MADNDIFRSDETDELGTVVLTLDDDTDLTCEIIAIYPAGDNEYIALLPDDDSDEVLIFRFIDNGSGDPEIENIEDDDEYEMAADAFDEILDEAEFDEADED